MTNVMSITVEYYQKAMEFADLSRIYKAKGNDKLSNEYLKEAFFLSKKAAERILTDENATNLEKASYLRSTGWLALKLGEINQALQFAQKGLEFRKLIPQVEVVKLETLQKEAAAA